MTAKQVITATEEIFNHLEMGLLVLVCVVCIALVIRGYRRDGGKNDD